MRGHLGKSFFHDTKPMSLKSKLPLSIDPRKIFERTIFFFKSTVSLQLGEEPKSTFYCSRRHLLVGNDGLTIGTLVLWKRFLFCLFV